jgi:hypothetical protein
MKLKRFLTLSLAAISFIALTNCQRIESKKNGGLTVMTYNVENLFDLTPDVDRDDYSYLPLELKQQIPNQAQNCEKMGKPGSFYYKECMEMDWNADVLHRKMSRLADTILNVNGIGPDVLLVQEVENINVLNWLNDKYLADAKYKTVALLEGEDKRGIDVGVMSRYPLAGPVKIHLIEFTPPPPPRPGQPVNPNPTPWKRPTTRGILEVPLLLPSGETLYVFTFHFPSQSNPKWQRLDAVNTLNKLLESKGPDALVIAGGDCNISSQEEAKENFVKNILASKWTVSHLAGCRDCVGTEAFFEKDRTTGQTKLSWSFFDILLFSPGLSGNTAKGAYRLDPESIKIQSSGQYQLRQDPEAPGVMVPSRFDDNGVSDHLPMYAELLRQKGRPRQ